MTPYYQDDQVTLLLGDTRAVLATLPAQSVHGAVTSPPFWTKRDYGVEGQLGREPTLDLFLAHLVEVFAAVKRVLRDDGTCWVEMGDSMVDTISQNVPHTTNVRTPAHTPATPRTRPWTRRTLCP